ncbi:uncharacterized protein LOC114713895 [Neltuma alba]|uniref:uncharacterized protein LOC114713895 n=1 Tax=Neltuma alba TaxID=207710 RepID=UPI0010A551EF|nr:uncharacterized protein LOC114713895 [Prosopis alba]
MMLPLKISSHIPCILLLICLLSSSISYSSQFVLFLFLHCYTMHHNHQPSLPCLYCHPQRYITMVQNLIERCLILHMSQDQCVKALAEHARIAPLVTLTVWKELQKENKDFFRVYFQVISPRPFFPSRSFHRGPRLARRKQWK